MSLARSAAIAAGLIACVGLVATTVTMPAQSAPAVAAAVAPPMNKAMNQLDPPLDIALTAAQVGAAPREEPTILVPEEPLHGYATVQQPVPSAQQADHPGAIALITYRPDGIFPYGGGSGIDSIRYTATAVGGAVTDGTIDITIGTGNPVLSKTAFWLEPHPGVPYGELILNKATDIAYKVLIDGVVKGTYVPSATQRRMNVPGGSYVQVQPQNTSADPDSRLVGPVEYNHQYFELMRVTGKTDKSLVNKFRVMNPGAFPVTVTHPGGSYRLLPGATVRLNAPAERVSWAATNTEQRFTLRDAGTILTNQIRPRGRLYFACDGKRSNQAKFVLTNTASTETVRYVATTPRRTTSWYASARTTRRVSWVKVGPRWTITLKAVT